jgi:hypothetical protein
MFCHPTQLRLLICQLIHEATGVAFDLYQRHVSRPLAELVHEMAYNVEVNYLLGVRVEVASTPFAEDVQEY